MVSRVVHPGEEGSSHTVERRTAASPRIGLSVGGQVACQQRTLALVAGSLAGVDELGERGADGFQPLHFGSYVLDLRGCDIADGVAVFRPASGQVQHGVDVVQREAELLCVLDEPDHVYRPRRIVAVAGACPGRRWQQPPAFVEAQRLDGDAGRFRDLTDPHRAILPRDRLDPEVRYRVHNDRVIVELRSVPDCPNLDRVRTILYATLAELGLPPAVIERVGDYPSPSVLIDGVDVMGTSDGPAACRLDLPAAEDLKAALCRATEATSPAAGLGLAVADCCAQPGDAIRADRPDRAARLSPELRQVHHAILRHFATTGTVPDLDDLAAAATRVGLDPHDALRQLAADDLIALDRSDALVAAYPFSPTPTAHVVSLGQVHAFAMCAIDALGIPFMLDRDATLRSTDPQTGQPIQITAAAGMITFVPPQAVVVYAATARAGRSVDSCCSTINFFTSPDTARGWLADRPELAATVLDQDQAVQLARDIFEPLLSRIAR